MRAHPSRPAFAAGGECVCCILAQHALSLGAAKGSRQQQQQRARGGGGGGGGASDNGKSASSSGARDRCEGERTRHECYLTGGTGGLDTAGGSARRINNGTGHVREGGGGAQRGAAGLGRAVGVCVGGGQQGWRPLQYSDRGASVCSGGRKQTWGARMRQTHTGEGGIKLQGRRGKAQCAQGAGGLARLRAGQRVHQKVSAGAAEGRMGSTGGQREDDAFGGFKGGRGGKGGCWMFRGEGEARVGRDGDGAHCKGRRRRGARGVGAWQGAARGAAHADTEGLGVWGHAPTNSSSL